MCSSHASTTKPDRETFTSSFRGMGLDLRVVLPYLPLLINAVLVVLIGLTAARLFWALWPVHSPSMPSAVVQEHDARVAAPAEIDVQRIATRTCSDAAPVESRMTPPSTRLRRGLISPSPASSPMRATVTPGR